MLHRRTTPPPLHATPPSLHAAFSLHAVPVCMSCGVSMHRYLFLFLLFLLPLFLFLLLFFFFLFFSSSSFLLLLLLLFSSSLSFLIPFSLFFFSSIRSIAKHDVDFHPQRPCLHSLLESAHHTAPIPSLFTRASTPCRPYPFTLY
jgi:hypothetical protein